MVCTVSSNVLTHSHPSECVSWEDESRLDDTMTGLPEHGDPRPD